MQLRREAEKAGVCVTHIEDETLDKTYVHIVRGRWQLVLYGQLAGAGTCTSRADGEGQAIDRLVDLFRSLADAVWKARGK